MEFMMKKIMFLMFFYLVTGFLDHLTVAAPISLQGGELLTDWGAQEQPCTHYPEFLVHRYNQDFVILRQSACVNFEKPFLYLIFGQDRAILFDTGADGGSQLALVIQKLLDERAANRRQKKLELIVTHLHAHQDHIAGDGQFRGRPNTQLIPPTLEGIKKLFNITDWPHQTVTYDLGGRLLDIVPIPGHDETSIAVYDRLTGILLTGDSLYPGRLYVNTEVGEFLESMMRLEGFTKTRPIAHVLGTHIENTRTPFVDYPLHTKFQPHEHCLELGRAHLLELRQALESLKAPYSRLTLRDFSICGKYPAC
jgi:hydroxyacylglutathione hydrolase